jgi:RNA polymerase sigma-70 factor (ECF subfamily)
MASTTDPHEAANFRGLFERNSRQVFSYARRHTDPEVAEQVTMDTFLAAWRHEGRLPETELPWLLVVARNLIATHYRNRSRQAREQPFARFHPDLAVSGSLESEVIERQGLIDCLHRLGPDDREVLLLVAWDGLDYDGAAAVLGISRNAFAQRLARARQRLETCAAEPSDGGEVVRLEMSDRRAHPTAGPAGTRR